MTTAVATMAAAVLSAPARSRLTRVPVPEPGAAEALVRIEGCGVCASSLPLWEGRPWFDYPRAAGEPGHEAWGIVEHVGEHVDSLEPGMRVWLLCDRAFAELAVAPAAHCVAADDPVPGEPVACAVNVVRRADVRAGDRVAIVGMGFLGSLVAQLCERRGARVVPVRRDSEIHDAFECVIECTGTQAALDTASRLVAERGRLVVAGYHQDGPRTIDLQSWNWRGIDVVNAHERSPEAYVSAMREAAALHLDVAPLLTHRFPLDALDDAFAAARDRPPGFVKAWVEP
jgi:threonine dehydrogenase-like Zn-dependent dehydrogenase